VLIPIGLLMIGAPFVFGYAKPVPVNFSRLRNFRRDMALVALAGPASNILLAIGALAVAHLAPMPSIANASVAEMVLAASHPELTNWPWITSMLLLMIGLNLILAVFNMLPIPPLDGGRILVAVLPDWAAWKVARLERAGLFIVIGLLFLVPALSRELGYSLDVTGVLIWLPVDALMTVLAVLTGH
jgi:Zn-dependent protease